MSQYEIKNLRKSGQLEEAMAMAQQELEANPEMKWIKMEMGWIYDAQCKQIALQGDYDKFCEVMDKIVELGILGDTMLGNVLCWRFQALTKNMKLGAGQTEICCGRLADYARQLNPDKPSNNYTVLCKAFHKLYKDYGWTGYADFIDWWGWDNFAEEDYRPFVTSDGTKIMSFVEQVCNAYTREMLRKAQLNVEGVKEKIEAHEERLSALMGTHPEYQYTALGLTKLLLETGDREAAMEKVKPFVMRKRNDFWAWELLAKSTNDEELKLSCYCRALMCRAEDKFLGKVRLSAAEVFARHGYSAEAKHELEIIVETYSNEGWRLNGDVASAVQSGWFMQTVAAQDNRQFYREHCHLTEAFLYSEKPEMAIVITHVNEEKRMVNFTTEERKGGYFSYKALGKGFRPKVGEVYCCRMEQDNGEHYNVYTATKVEAKEYEGKLVKEFRGVLSLTLSGVGFVDREIFVSASMLRGLSEGEFVSGVAIPTFDKRKGRWGWAALTVRKA